MKQVLSYGATYDSNEHFIATELFVNKQQREMFMTLPSNHRFNWLTRRYITKYGIREGGECAMTCICLLFSLFYFIV
jgi:hypothetical protein